MSTTEISRRIGLGLPVSPEDLANFGEEGERPAWAPPWPARPPPSIELTIDKSAPDWWRKSPVPRPVTVPPPDHETLLPRQKDPYAAIAKEIDGLATRDGRPVKQDNQDVKALFQKYGVAFRQPHKKRVFEFVDQRNKLNRGNPQFVR